MKLLVGLLIYTWSLGAADVVTDFMSNEIVPDALDKAPNQLLTVSFNGEPIKFGEELTPTGTIQQPIVEWDFDASSYYTLIMSNLDPLSREHPQYREFLHWLVVNIPGADFSKGETIVEYAGVGPPKEGGIHRILLTVYKQPGKLEFNEPFQHNRKVGMRLRFSQRKYSSKYNLGDPVAGNMFTAQYDDYVPQLKAEFLAGVRV